jgi:hypothetical protein
MERKGAVERTRTHRDGESWRARSMPNAKQPKRGTETSEAKVTKNERGKTNKLSVSDAQRWLFV